MNLNVRYLEEFVTLTEKKNFLEAAECLFISQSCLSKHIKKLETEIGVELFERTTRTVVLTEFGQMLRRMRERWSVWNMNLKKMCAARFIRTAAILCLGRFLQ